MLRVYKYPLRALAHQRATFERWLDQCCAIYNAALEQRITWYRRAGKSVTYNDQASQWAELRNVEPEFASLPSDVGRSALRRLDRAYKAFFRRVKAKASRAGFPRFRSRQRYTSFGIRRRKIKVDPRDPCNAWVSLPDRTWVRFRMHRPMQGTIRDVTLSKDARGRWFVCFACDVGEAPPKRAVNPERVAGIDLGLTSFVVLHDGTEVANPRFFKRSQEALACAQRVLSRKKRGSKSRERARRVVARVHERVRNQRRGLHYKVAGMLVKRYDLIAHEDLNIAEMARSNLAKSIYDVGWGQFITILHSKAEEAGVHVIAVSPHNTTQACSSCGVIVPKGLGDRVHKCACGLTLGRDHNAAINVLARGLRAVPGLATGPEPQ